VLPWLGYRAIQRLDQLIEPDWKMIEFGSGLSTVWFSRRCHKVVSVEDCEEWYDKVKQDLSRHEITNVDYLFKTKNDYSSLPEYADEQFDLILVDGSDRGKCAATAVKRLKPGGYIYLDNSDKHSSAAGGDTRIAEQILLDAALEAGGQVEYFVDFLPTYVAVIQGMLVRL
jgi:predicted O-methyltransferase YrrM